jgi:hypothetical protein
VLDVVIQQKITPASLKDLEQCVLNTVEWLCQTMWQYATPRRQMKYPQYAMTEVAYQTKVRFREPESDEYVTEEYAAIVCDSIIALNVPDELSKRPPTPREAGRLMARLSMARCMLGAPATRVEFESYMRFRATRYARGDWEQTGPIDFVNAWAQYQCGYPHDVQVYLFHKLYWAYRTAGALARDRECRFDELCAFVYEQKEDHHYLDDEFLSTGVYVYSSMLAYLTPEGRH